MGDVIASGQCPAGGWTEIGGTKCFKVVTGSFSSAHNASVACNDLGANLAHITTNDENTQVATLVSDLTVQ